MQTKMQVVNNIIDAISMEQKDRSLLLYKVRTEKEAEELAQDVAESTDQWEIVLTEFARVFVSYAQHQVEWRQDYDSMYS